MASDLASDRCVLQTAEPVLRPIRGVRHHSDIAVGEKTFTIAAPSGLELTLGDGLVSSLRTLNGIPIVQSSAPMSPGSSGGALLDSKGNLLGIIAFILRDGQALGFAISAESYWTRLLLGSGVMDPGLGSGVEGLR